MKKNICIFLSLLLIFSLSACSFGAENQNQAEETPTEESREVETESLICENGEEQISQDTNETSNESDTAALSDDLPEATPGQVADGITRFTDGNGDAAHIPAHFTVSEKEDEQTISKG